MFENDKMTSQTALILPIGIRFEGPMVISGLTGYGVMTDNDGDRYEG
jgi:Sec-independent protein secretion pathway component TatC